MCLFSQIQTAFKAPGLRSTDSGKPYVDPAAWAAVNTPVCFLMGDKDKMCPPQVRVTQSSAMEAMSGMCHKCMFECMP